MSESNVRYKVYPEGNLFVLKDNNPQSPEYCKGSKEKCLEYLKKKHNNKRLQILENIVSGSRLIVIELIDKTERINIFKNLISMNSQEIVSSKIYNEYDNGYFDDKEKYELEISILVYVLGTMNEENFTNESFIIELKNICKQLKCNLIYPNLGDSYNAQIMSLTSSEESKEYQESSVIKVVKIGLRIENEIIIKSEVVISR